MLRVAAVQMLRFEIGGLDLLNAIFAIEAVDAPIDRQLDMRRAHGAGDGDLVSCAFFCDCLQRLMSADSVEQARGRRHRGKASGEHDGFYKRSDGDSALFQWGSFAEKRLGCV